jgi:hypothetical protein
LAHYPGPAESLFRQIPLSIGPFPNPLHPHHLTLPIITAKKRTIKSCSQTTTKRSPRRGPVPLGRLVPAFCSLVPSVPVISPLSPLKV